MKVILISGKAQHGKDTAACIIKKRLSKDGNSVLITHYADALKFVCTSFFGWNGEKDEYGRKMLQYVGTDVVRKNNPSLWVNFIIDLLKCFDCKWDYVIIPDCRFENEITNFRDQGFECVYLRVKRQNFESGLTDEQKRHPSETALDKMKPDYVLKNDGDIKKFEKTINKWIKEELYNDKSKR